VKLTLPPGVAGAPLDVSATVAVQVVPEPTDADAGEQLTEVALERVTPTWLGDALLLAACVGSCSPGVNAAEIASRRFAPTVPVGV
jgi:hypothetical protein